MFKLILIIISLTFIGCKSPPKISDAKIVETNELKKQNPAPTSNGLREFYTQMEKIKFDQPYKAEGQMTDLIIDLFQKKELIHLNVNQIKFCHNISDVFTSSYGSSSKAIRTSIGLIEGVPSDAVLHSIMRAGLWHLNDFTNGTLTINCWSKPNIED